MSLHSVKLSASRNPSHALHVANWLNNLARLVRKTAEDGSAEQIAEYTEMLLRDLPIAAFSIAARHHVARLSEWWPSYCILHTQLTDYWAGEIRKNSDVIAIQMQDSEERSNNLRGMDRRWYDFFLRREAQSWSEPDDNTVHPKIVHARRRRTLGLIKRESPAAFDILSEFCDPPVAERQVTA